jgi:hypothetical protein
VGATRATPTFEDSEWSRKFEAPLQEGWGRFFSKAASKGLPSERACQDPLTRQGGDVLSRALDSCSAFL